MWKEGGGGGGKDAVGFWGRCGFIMGGKFCIVQYLRRRGGSFWVAKGVCTTQLL